MINASEKRKIEAEVSTSTLEVLHALQEDSEQSLGEVIDTLVRRVKRLSPISSRQQRPKVSNLPFTGSK